MDKKIPLRLFNIKKISGNGEPLTLINNKLVIKDGVIKSVTFSDDFGILKLTGPGVGMKPGIMARVTTRLHEGSINIKSIITSQTAINILLAREDLSRSCKMIKEMAFSTVVKVSYIDDISLIAVVGEGMLDRPGIASRVFGAVSRQKVNILIISAGASSVATYFIIERKDREKTIRSIHEEFFRGGGS
jgi:aspartate kinase/aspartokinase/homoserine dehydrogenase 1